MLSDAISIEIVRGLTVAVPTTLAAVGSILGAFYAYQASKHAKIAAEQAIKTEQNTNHMKDELVAEVRKTGLLDANAAYQAGKREAKEGSEH